MTDKRTPVSFIAIDDPAEAELPAELALLPMELPIPQDANKATAARATNGNAPVLTSQTPAVREAAARAAAGLVTACPRFRGWQAACSCTVRCG